MERQERQDKEDMAPAILEEHRCILCDVLIEIAEHDVFFTTGRCRFCHEALENEDNNSH